MDCAVKTPGTFLEIVTRFVNATEVLFMDIEYALRRFKEEVFSLRKAALISTRSHRG